MTGRVTTTCCGVALSLGLLIPSGAALARTVGQSVPTSTGTPSTAPAAPAQQPAAPATQQPAAPSTQQPATPAAPAAPPGATTAPPPKPPPPPPPPYAVRWTQPVGLTSTPQLVVTRSAVILGGGGVTVSAHALDDGRVLWSSEITPSASLAAGDGLVFVPAADGLHALDEATGALRWELKSAEPVHIAWQPARLIVATGRALRGLSAADGRQLWLRDLPAGWRAGPAQDPGVGAVALDDGSVLGFDPVTGVDRWRTPTELKIGAMTIINRLVLFGTGDGSGCAIHALRGDLAWCYPVRVPLVGAPTADARFFYFAFYDNTVRALSARGDLRRRTNLPARPAAGPSLVGPYLLVPLATGEVTVMNASDGKIVLHLGLIAEQATLETAAVSPADKLIASVIVLPGSERRLTLYGPPLPAAPPK